MGRVEVFAVLSWLSDIVCFFYSAVFVQVVVESDVIPKLVPLLDSKDNRVLVCGFFISWCFLTLWRKKYNRKSNKEKYLMSILYRS